ncbi:type II toxin-antitoxin system ParD family antitoxin (plasmid) [Rhizobium lusitanum]|uniref:type II toxin-antitoxin system ParD family antitoxin n=1 Tax=Rhizobium lusitanum TaxID=293958 RepID=UPI00160850B9|nr:type II toxin-antitoxin system ParD family antitoxin [Rhizobium lusitanum]QND44621.1 type II toxin-antitoxin system ParD family antitoxin [Rhizobium lusitanum]
MASSADLGKRLENYVSDLIRVGRYNSRSEVLREGVRLVEEREKRLAVLDAAIERSLADADAGRIKPISEVASRLAAKYERMAEDAGK